MELIKIDPVPVWKFFEIPEDAVEWCKKRANKKGVRSQEGLYWKRAAAFLETVKVCTVDKLPERDFDWMLKLRVQFENDLRHGKVENN